MYFTKSALLSLGLLATSQLVAGHGAIVKAVGDQGGQGSAIGIDPTTPRDGKTRNPFQQDSTRFKNAAANQCGETLGGGTNDVVTGTQKVMAQNPGQSLPQVSAGGSLMMTLHQVNADGAGPYTCMIDSTGTGTQWTAMQVTTNIDGNARGRNADTALMDLPLNVQIDAAQTCNGTVAGQSNVCMVRCQNPARAGPFGGCVPIQMASAAGNTTAAAAPAAGAAAAAAAAQPAAGTANAAGATTAATAGTASTGASTGSTAGVATGATSAGTASGSSTNSAAAAPALSQDGEEEELTRRATPLLTDDGEEEEVEFDERKVEQSFAA